MKKVILLLIVTGCLAPGATAVRGADIVHDAEHNILKAQHGTKWAKEDAEIDAKLAEIREKNGGKPPNFVYILLDDLAAVTALPGYLSWRTKACPSCGCIPSPVARRPVLL
jgi:arylsulfatase